MERGKTLNRIVELVTEECNDCGVMFGIPIYLRNQRIEDHQWFYCPNGHQLHYTGQTEAQKLQRQLTAERDRTNYWRDEHQREKRSHSATKGQLTKARRRIGRGVCPCCNRSFPALAEHMKTEHPEVADG